MALTFKQLCEQAAARGLKLERTNAPGFYRLLTDDGSEMQTGSGNPWTLAAVDLYLAKPPPAGKRRKGSRRP